MQRSNDLQATLQLWETFRTKWEEDWRDALFVLENTPDGEREPDLRRLLWGMLDWIDWLGVLVQTHSIRKPHALLRLMGPQLDRILGVTVAKIARDDEAHGPEFWSGLHTVERLIASGSRRTARMSAKLPRRPDPESPVPLPEPGKESSEPTTGSSE